MKAVRPSVVRSSAFAAALAALALTFLNACAVTGYDGDVGVGYDAGYYEPWGYDYGGWGDGYLVGPGRGGWDRGDRGDWDREGRGGWNRGGRGGWDGGGREGRGGGSYRAAPGGQRAPSIPSHARGGGRR